MCDIKRDQPTQPTVYESFQAKLAADERALSLMLPRWKASLYGEPFAVFDKSGNLVGLAPECAIGEVPTIIVRVSDIADDDGRDYRPASSS
jgi:hypothetical protein